jgi:predicted ATPase
LTNSDINITAKAITEKPEYKERVLELLVRADLSIHDFSVSKLRMPDKMYDSLPIIDEVKSKIDRMVFGVSTFHLVRDNTDNVAGLRQMDMKRHESMGTQRIFDLAYPLLDTLDNGKVLYIDEFETYLHPRESAFIIDLFKSAENKNGAQLIVNTHNKQIMDQIGRNNIFLVDKNFKEESIIGKIKTARTDDRNLEKKYDKGFFGAVPDVRINL